jgi:hypothetical protein
MNVGPLSIRSAGDGRIRVSALVDERELWFEIAETTPLPATPADSFAIMGLAGSMLRKQPLTVHESNPVSSVLLEHFPVIQDILHCWNRNFHRIPVHASSIEPSTPLRGVACLYSGGVDSMHAALCHRNMLTDAVFIGGFDFAVGSDQMINAVERSRSALEILGIPLLVVHSNQIAWGWETGVARDFWFSGYLAAATLFFRFERVLIPSGLTYAELGPHGSHPLLDPLWSNGTTRFEYVDGEWRRSEKLARIASDSRLLAQLHVCWRNPLKNCGECPKCRRTMVALELLGLHGPFPRRASPSDVRSLRANNTESLSFLIDFVLLAHDRGRPEMLRAAKAAVRRYDREKALESLDRAFLGGNLRKLRKRVRPYNAREGITNGRPDLDLQ